MLDVVIIGAGPVGLYAAFYAGLRGLKGMIVESRDQMGGQANQFFKDKIVYDFPGIKKTTGQGLANALFEQYNQFSDQIPLKLNTLVQKLEKIKGGFKIHINDEYVETKTICMAVGPGTAISNKLNIPGEDNFDITYTVSNIEDFYNKEIVIFGGGDSAVDWANTFKNKSKVTIIHRRNEFKAKATAVEQLITSKVNILKPYSAKGVKNNKFIVENENGERQKIKFQKALVQFGFKTAYGNIKESWGLEFEKGRIKVDGWRKTNIDGIWAVGNASYYEGKNAIIASGLGDVVSAMSSIATYINPKASPLFYSTNKK